MRDEWLRMVEALQNQISDWVRQEPDWVFEEAGSEEIEEPPLGKYSVTVWSIRTPEGEARLEPIRRDFLGRMFVELYAWPTLRRVYLLHNPQGNGWRVRTDSGIFLRQEWTRENFILLIQDLIEAE